MKEPKTDSDTRQASLLRAAGVNDERWLRTTSKYTIEQVQAAIETAEANNARNPAGLIRWLLENGSKPKAKAKAKAKFSGRYAAYIET